LYQGIKSILEKGLDRRAGERERWLNSPVHQNVRGRAYYAATSKTEGLCHPIMEKLQALRLVGMAHALKQHRQLVFRQDESPTSRRELVAYGCEKERTEGKKKLIRFGHLRKTPGRASLCSDNCPTIPDCGGRPKIGPRIAI
jgi:hypothetical protein